MKVPLRWLQEFIELPTTDPVQLSNVLTMLGHEVENFDVIEPGGRMSSSARSSRSHASRCRQDPGVPGGDRIRSSTDHLWCMEFLGGAHVAVAQPGAMLPGDFEIGRRTIRGWSRTG